MKIAREIKVGITVLITIILFIWMYSFLKGKNLLTKSSSYYVIYNEVSGLTETNPVEVSGYKVGVVQNIRFIQDGSGRLLVTLSIDKKMRIPVGSVSEITAASLIAGMKIQIVFSESQDMYRNGDTIPGLLAESVFTRLEEELSPLQGNITEAIKQLDSVMMSVNSLLNPSFISDLEATIANLNRVTGSLANTLSSKEKEISAAIDNLQLFTRTLADNSEKIDASLSNLAQITDSVAAADLTGTINSLRDTAARTSALLEGLNNGEGSAGKLFTNDSLYTNLAESLSELSLLLEDVRKNPKRYVHFSLFGKK